MRTPSILAPCWRSSVRSTVHCASEAAAFVSMNEIPLVHLFSGVFAATGVHVRQSGVNVFDGGNRRFAKRLVEGRILFSRDLPGLFDKVVVGAQRDVFHKILSLIHLFARKIAPRHCARLPNVPH
jgi:hypothetical protein